MTDSKKKSYFSETANQQIYEYIISDDKSHIVYARCIKGAYEILSRILGYKIYSILGEIYET